MRRNIFLPLLVLLFFYSGFSKLFGWEAFTGAMHNQPFPHFFSNLIIWTLPALEIGTAVTLLFARTQRVGLISSFVLLILFTTYISAILLHFFHRIPCSCGGLFHHLTWRQHLLVNILLTIFSALALFRPSNKSSILSPI